MMKKNLLKLGLLSLLSFSMMSYAQTRNVGINTEDPTRTLDVNGMVRVRDLPEKELHNNKEVQGFLYNVVAQEDGTLSRQLVSRRRWNLYESAFNTRSDIERTLPEANQITADETLPANCWEIPNSELFIEVPDIANTNVLTKISWNTWFEITPRDITDTDRGSFRFYLKYQETDKNGTPVANSTVNYTKTIYMTSFSNINKAISGNYHRVGMTPSYSERLQQTFKKGKYYKVSLVVGLESMKTAGVLMVKNWGISGEGETYYQYQ
ncbi:hypothetical protein ACFFUE_08975 [Bergeyella porcorum]|uniref:hypothetical protein n=1 Tax=Bergeyella porcorum TaxID=1735111 RepID=UPI0035EFF18B